MNPHAEGNRKRLQARLGDRTYDISIEENDGFYRVHLGDECFTVQRERLSGAGLVSLLIDNCPYEVEVEKHSAGFSVVACGTSHVVEILDPLRALVRKVSRTHSAPGVESIVAPMPGLVVSVEVQEGDRVEAGTPLVVVEAMKMQNELSALRAGVVEEVKVKPGQKVDTREVLVVLAQV